MDASGGRRIGAINLAAGGGNLPQRGEISVCTNGLTPKYRPIAGRRSGIRHAPSVVMSKTFIVPMLLAVSLWAVPARAQTSDTSAIASSPLPCAAGQVDSPADLCPPEPSASGEQPLALGRQETSAAPSWLIAPSVHLVDIPVFTHDDHAITLRFTLAGTPPVSQPAPASTACLPGQTLFTIHVDVIKGP